MHFALVVITFSVGSFDTTILQLIIWYIIYIKCMVFYIYCIEFEIFAKNMLFTTNFMPLDCNIFIIPTRYRATCEMRHLIIVLSRLICYHLNIMDSIIYLTDHCLILSYFALISFYTFPSNLFYSSFR